MNNLEGYEEALQQACTIEKQGGHGRSRTRLPSEYNRFSSLSTIAVLIPTFFLAQIYKRFDPLHDSSCIIVVWLPFVMRFAKLVGMSKHPIINIIGLIS
ncbi:hypothetical protein [Brevibacillus reuszeri]|uniref:hypothetical protein n=1 Tax=Brevibacillus reuszeri TaxID=54915 RepID=UPI001BB3A2BB|nr:hypothetical protein [Brevibacillus reuszeri]